MSEARGRITTYDLRDEEGRPVAHHVREDTPEGKQVRWQRPDGSWGLNGTPLADLPLYGAEAVSDVGEDELIVLTEGEKARDALEAANLPAVGTVTGASGTPGPEALEVLRDRRVVLWPDNDPAGLVHMQQVAEALHGVAAEVLVYTWDEAPEKGDAADHPAVRSRDPKAVDRLLTDLEGSPRWKPAPRSRAAGYEQREDLAGRVLLARAIEEGIEPPVELEPDVLLRGRVHSIYAASGTGKTWLMLWLAARGVERRARVLILDMENGPRIVSERLADLGVSTEHLDERLAYYSYPSLTLEREAVAAYTALLDEFQPDLVIFDSWINFLASAGLDENVSNDIARWAVNFTHPARERGITVVLLDHVPHENSHARGSSRKRDEVDAMWRLVNRLPFDRDTVGEIALHREKDREGWLPLSVGFSVGGGEGGFIFRRSDGTLEEPGGADGLTASQRLALDVLRSEFADEGATATEWMKVSGLARATFFRAKNAIVARPGLVVSKGRRYYPIPSPEKGLTDPPERGARETSDDTSTVGSGITRPESGDTSETRATKGKTSAGLTRSHSGITSQMRPAEERSHSVSHSFRSDTGETPVRLPGKDGPADGEAWRVERLFADPPGWLRDQVAEYRRQGSPERLLNPLAAAVASELFGSPHRWREILLEVRDLVEGVVEV